MTANLQLAADSRWRIFLLSGILAVVGMSLLVATQNYYLLSTRGRPTPWLPLFLGELPVWFAWLAMLPGITWLARRFPPHRGLPLRNVLIHLLAGCAAVYAMLIFTETVRRVTPGALTIDGPILHVVSRSFLPNLVPFLIVYAAGAALAIAWQYHWAMQAQQIRESQLEAQLARTRLDVLRAQIQPHFLFNTLHAISALMGRDINAARRMMRRLSELLRISLDDSGGDEVPLSAELDFLDSYLDIQRLRFGERLNVTFHIEERTRRVPVPRLILQPIVENSIKHGISRRPEAENIAVESELVGDSLLLRVKDDGPGFRTPGDILTRTESATQAMASGPNESVGAPPRGIGLANTRARLHELYGDRASVRVHDGAVGAVVELKIPVTERHDE